MTQLNFPKTDLDANSTYTENGVTYIYDPAVNSWTGGSKSIPEIPGFEIPGIIPDAAVGKYTAEGCAEIGLDGINYGSEVNLPDASADIYVRWKTSCLEQPHETVIEGKVTHEYEGKVVAESSAVYTLQRVPNNNDEDITVVNVSPSSITESKTYSPTGFGDGGETTFVYGTTDSLVTPQINISTGSGIVDLPSTKETAIPVSKGVTISVSHQNSSLVSTPTTTTLEFTDSFQEEVSRFTYTSTTAAVVPSIQTPTIVSPANGSIDIVPDITLEGDTYVPNNHTEPHASSDWEVYETGKVPIETDVIIDVESQDGSWISASATEANSWQSVTYGVDKFVAVANSGANRVMYSADGISWIAKSATEANSWASVAYGNNMFVAVSGDGTNQVMYSDDGISWTAMPAAADIGWITVAYGDGRFVAVSSTGNSSVGVMRWLNGGTQWFSSAAAENTTWQSVTYGGTPGVDGKFVAVANTGTDRVMYSSNGNAWTSASAAEPNEWHSVTYGNGKFVAVATDGANRGMYSDDGISWTAVSLPSSENQHWESVTFGDGKFVAVASSGTNRAISSTDGINWTEASTPIGATWYSVAQGGGKFVAVGTGGIDSVMWSYTGTGITETSLTLADSTNLDRLSVGEQVEMDSAGAPETSAITNVVQSPGWKPGSFDFVDYALGVAYGTKPDGNNIYMALGRPNANGAISQYSTSTDAITWTPKANMASPGESYAQIIGNAVGLAASTSTPSMWCTLINDGSYGRLFAWSTDGGERWSSGNMKTPDYTRPEPSWSQLAYGHGYFVGVSNSTSGGVGNVVSINESTNVGTYLTLSELVWNDIASGFVVGGNRGFMAVGRTSGGYGQIWYSTNDSGTAWNNITTPILAFNFTPLSIAYGKQSDPDTADGRWVLIGDNSSLDLAYYSDDNGATWTQSNDIEKYSANTKWESIVWSDNKYVAVGTDYTGAKKGSMWSLDGIDWHITETTTSAGWNDVTYGAEAGFVAVGSKEYVAGSQVGPHVMYSIDGKGNFADLTLTDDTNLGNLRVGDVVTETTGSATGTITDIVSDPDPTGDNIITLSPTTGDWTGSTSTVTGPTFTAEGELLSIDEPNNKLVVKDVTGRFLETKVNQTINKLNKTVIDPSTLVPPGSPSDPVSAEYTPVIPESTTLTTADLTKDQLNEDKVYYSRVKYKSATIESEFSDYHEFTTKDDFSPKPGDEYEGGYFAGQTNYNGTIYNLIVAPISSGSLTGEFQPTSCGAGVEWTGGAANAAIARDKGYGAPSMVQFVNSSAAFNFVINSVTGPNAGAYDVTNATGTGIGGFNDWYVPSEYELNTAYYYLKPTADANEAGYGANPNAVSPQPINSDWDLFDPTRTASPIFQSGGSEAFGNGATNGYWTATSVDAPNVVGSEVYRLIFTGGNSGQLKPANSTMNLAVRAIRRVPA